MAACSCSALSITAAKTSSAMSGDLTPFLGFT